METLKPLFEPILLNDALIEISANIKRDNNANLRLWIAGLVDNQPQEDTTLKAMTELLSLFENLGRWFTGPDLTKHPLYLSYVLGWEWQHYDLTNHISQSITENPDLCMVYMKSDATIEQCLETLDEWERIAQLVVDDYYNVEYFPTWDLLGLGSDDDVDYAGTYLFSIVEFFRIYLYIKTQDNRFITI